MPACGFMLTKNRQLIGRIGEIIAEKYLVQKGFCILQRNWTCRWGEIDIIAEKDDFLVFVEVKYRACKLIGHPSESINFYKRKSLQRSINMYLNKNFVVKPWRFDLLCVSKDGVNLKIDYYEYVSL